LSSRWTEAAQNNDTIIVPLAHKDDVAEIVELLDQRQIKFDELELKKPSLEDVFLDMTEANPEQVA
jgi:hypothetical protein